MEGDDNDLRFLPSAHVHHTRHNCHRSPTAFYYTQSTTTLGLLSGAPVLHRRVAAAGVSVCVTCNIFRMYSEHQFVSRHIHKIAFATHEGRGNNH